MIVCILRTLSKLLVALNFNEYTREMTRRSLDWINLLGKETYECFRYICTMEKNMLEAARDNGGFSNIQLSQPVLSTVANPAKGKSTGIFATLDASEFPCPMINHDHKIAACAEFFAFTPKDRWFEIPKGRICYTCLKPK